MLDRLTVTAATASSAQGGGAPADDPGSVIDYRIPEAVTYPGQFVIALNDYQMSQGDFAETVAANGAAPPAAAGSSTAPARGGVARAASTTASVSLPASVVAPKSVVTSDSSKPADPVIALSPFDLSARLRALTWSDVAVAAADKKRVEIYRSVGGNLDYRVREVPAAAEAAPSATPPKTVTAQGGSTASAVAPVAVMASSASLVPLLTAPQIAMAPGPVPPPIHPYLALTITAPNPSNASLQGPAGGFFLPVTGSVVAVLAGKVTIQVEFLDVEGKILETANGSLAPNNEWSASIPVTQSGSFAVSVTATGNPGLRAQRSVLISVALAPPAGGPTPAPKIAPSVAITSPSQNAVITDPSGRAIVTVAGSVDTRGGGAITATSVTPDGGASATPKLTAVPNSTVLTFTTTVELDGEGIHTVSLEAINTDNLSSPAVTVAVLLAARQPVRAVDRRLYIIEKVAITAYADRIGAGRVLKTFSLLPGEETTISIDTYSKDETTAKAARSIVDSTASECAADFEDTLSQENSDRSSSSDKAAWNVSAEANGSWLFASASIKGGYSDETNAAREEATKTVLSATTKHTSKASSNRNVTINTDFSQTVDTGTTTDTKRTIKNINVSRVLNFVFRQMTQEHVVLVHLVDATLGYYKEDILLDATGRPQIGPDGGPLAQHTFTEYTIPEIAAFERTEMSGPAMTTLQLNLLNVLGQIPDHDGKVESLVELVVPKDLAGTDMPDASYLRVRRDLTSQYASPSGAQFSVPGILLAATTTVLRTDQVVCDALLGAGEALDEYSHALQQLAIAERQAAVDERVAATAREKLAQRIVAQKDGDMAAMWPKVYPQPLSVPATVTLAASPSDGQPAPVVE